MSAYVLEFICNCHTHGIRNGFFQFSGFDRNPRSQERVEIAKKKQEERTKHKLVEDIIYGF